MEAEPCLTGSVLRALVGARVGPALGGCDGAADGAELGATEGDAPVACDGDMLRATEGDSPCVRCALWSQPAVGASATASASAAAARAASMALAPHPQHVPASPEPVTTLPPKPTAARVLNAARDVRQPGWPGLNVTWADTRPLRIVVVANGKVSYFPIPRLMLNEIHVMLG